MLVEARRRGEGADRHGFVVIANFEGDHALKLMRAWGLLMKMR